MLHFKFDIHSHFNTLGAKQGGHKGQDQGRDREECQRRECQFQDAKQKHD